MNMSAQTARELGEKRRMEQIYNAILNSSEMFRCQVELSERELKELTEQGYLIEEVEYEDKLMNTALNLSNKLRAKGYKLYTIKW